MVPDTLLEEITKFIKEKQISESNFCRLAELSPSWFSKRKKGHCLRMKPATLKKIRDLLSGDTPIPEWCIIVSKSPPLPEEFDVMPMLKHIVSKMSGPISYTKLLKLLQAEQSLRVEGLSTIVDITATS